jgi:predicted DCC family thiol-disulfide oxidoreductase YuxK
MSAVSALSPPAASVSPAECSRDDAPIIYFDGVCGLCNRSVDRVMAWDREQVFRFAPLQGETAAARLSPEDTRNLDSLVVQVDGKTYHRSSAVVRILWRLGGVAGLFGTLLWLIPRPLRDLGYRVVATNRYRMFGKKETCRMPTPEERARFLP